MPNVPTSRPSTFWEAIGAMFKTSYGCGGSEVSNGSILDDSALTDGIIADGVLADGAAISDAGYFPDGIDSYSSPCLDLSPEEAGLKINELLYNPEGSDAGFEWVELFNKSPGSLNISGFTLTNREAAPLATLPDWTMPPCSYLVVHFGYGTNDDTFINGAAHFFNGPATGPFDNSRDEVALYSGQPSAETIEDFVAYSDAGEISEGHAFKHAKTAGIWQTGGFFDTAGVTQPDTAFISLIVAEGDTIGRDRYSTDTDTSADWAITGGVDSMSSTPGSENYTPISVAPPMEVEAQQQEEKEWTFMVYMAADNELEKLGFFDLNQMEKVGSGNNVNIVVFVDFAKIDLNSKKDKAATAARILIKKDEEKDKEKNEANLVSSVWPTKNEPNTGKYSTLGNFIYWAMKTYPAKKYYLVMWGHGGGWKGTAWDFFGKTKFSETNDRLTIEELGKALQYVPKDKKIDILSFHSCMMAVIDVAYQIRTKVDIMIASQEVIFGGEWGMWPLVPILEKLENEPATEPEKLAEFVVDETEEVYKTKKESRTVSAIRLNSDDFPKLIKAISDFAEELKKGLEDWGKGKTVHDEPADNVQRLIREIIQGYGNVDSFSKNPVNMWGSVKLDYRDLSELARRINEEKGIADAWKAKAATVRDLVEKVVIKRENGDEHKHAKGISIYFPSAHTPSEHAGSTSYNPSSFDVSFSPLSIDRQLYAADDDKTIPPEHPLPPAVLKFVKDTLWAQFLHRYYNPVADASCIRKDAPPNEKSSSACIGKVIDSNGDGIGDKPSVKLSAKGSSDSDGKFGGDGMVLKYFWDFDDSENTDEKDYDKDGDDDAEDDSNDVKIETEFICKKDVEYKVRLMVWDNHNEVNDDTSGNHAGHYQTDDEFVTIKCVK